MRKGAGRRLGVRGIGELNESSLHARLKALYLGQGAVSEVPVGRYVADVVLADGRVVEVQTRHLYKLKPKLAALLAERPVRLVFPVAAERHLVVYDAKGRNLLYRRRSPRRGTVLSLLDELVGVASLLAHPRFEVEVLLTREEEVRRKDGSGSWRRRGAARVDRRVLEVLERRLFRGPADYAGLLPESCPPRFGHQELASAMSAPLWQAHRLSYCLRAAGVLRVAGREGRRLLLERTQAQRPEARKLRGPKVDLSNRLEPGRVRGC
jgi:hypothetical protein